jgi:exonuclease VII small subunit
MSAEELIRIKHRIENEVAALQKSLKVWGKRFALLSTQELELATAKALDLMTEAPEDREKRFKLSVLSNALKQRPANYKVSMLKRFWIGHVADVAIGNFLSEDLRLPVEVDDETLWKIIEAS